MDQLQIRNTTYVIHHIFSGNKTPVELIHEKMVEASNQVLPLTTPSTNLYNTDGNQPVVRSSL